MAPRKQNLHMCLILYFFWTMLTLFNSVTEKWFDPGHKIGEVSLKLRIYMLEFLNSSTVLFLVIN